MRFVLKSVHKFAESSVLKSVICAEERSQNCKEYSVLKSAICAEERLLLSGFVGNKL
jgi:hypothetical protein